ncbi:MAG: universal stress protein [Deltaproteobacteria bacterium]|nr:universal stress protein [Deltaproteobacteria bacterium]
MEIKKILWPTDLSGNAGKAQGAVDSLAEKYQAEVHVLYVMEDPAIHEPWYGDFDREHIEKIQAWEREQAKKRLDEVCDKALKGCSALFKEIALGDPAEEILKVIERENVDLVVMTARGRTGSFPFGSVTEKVVKNASIPVLTIPIAGPA